MFTLIRNRFAGFFAKVLLALIVVSFAFWGMGDMLRSPGYSKAAAVVGGEVISVAEFQKNLKQRENYYRRMMGESVTPEMLKALGIESLVLSEMVNERLLDLETRRFGIQIGEEAIMEHVRNDPTFQDESGKFSKERFRFQLQNSGFTEKTYIQELQKNMASGILLASLRPQLNPPPALVNILFGYYNEKREAKYVVLPPDYIKTAPEPSDSDLLEFYTKHSAQFAAPELRSFTYLILKESDVAADLRIPEEELQAAYETRKDEFHHEESRHVEQLLFSDEESAQKAHERLEKGEKFATVAESSATGKTGDLGQQTLAGMPAGGDAVFALEKGKYSAPVQSDFGWHIFRVKDITPASTTPFKEVRKQLEKEMLAEKAGESLYRATTSLEDALAGGATLEEAASALGLKTATAGSVSAEGKLADGTAAALPELSGLLTTAFAQEAQTTSPVTAAEDGSHFVVRVDTVTPGRDRPLDEVRALAIAAWKKAHKEEALATLVNQKMDALKKGADIEQIASELKLPVRTTAAITRNAGQSQREDEEKPVSYPQALVQKMFATAKKGVIPTPTRTEEGGFILATVERIIPAQKGEADEMQALTSNLKEQVSAEILQQYLEFLRNHYTVETYHAENSGSPAANGEF